MKSTAAQLARLKVTYPLWRIYRYESGDSYGSEQFVADEREGRRRLIGATPAALENELIRISYRWEDR